VVIPTGLPHSPYFHDPSSCSRARIARSHAQTAPTALCGISAPHGPQLPLLSPGTACTTVLPAADTRMPIATADLRPVRDPRVPYSHTAPPLPGPAGHTPLKPLHTGRSLFSRVLNWPLLATQPYTRLGAISVFTAYCVWPGKLYFELY